MIGPVAFAAPWLLIGLAALPLLWLILRAVPPAPVRRRFPGVVLLLGLKDEDATAERTPWWLMMLRMLAVAALIVGFAGPVLNPERPVAGGGPLLIVVDGTWADARDWDARTARIADALAEAGRAGRPAAIVSLTDLPGTEVEFRAADAVLAGLPSIAPRPWEPDPAEVAAFAAALPAGRFDSLWLSDGLARDGREVLMDALRARGDLTVFQVSRPVLGLRSPRFEGDQIVLDVVRSTGSGAADVEVAALGPDPGGVERELARASAPLADGALGAELRFDLPPELRNRVTRFAVAGVRSAGAVALTDDGLKRPEIALIDGGGDREGLELLSPSHYLRQALSPTADIIGGTLSDVLLADPDTIIMADVARIAEQQDLLAWVEQGGVLVRFAGPRLAASDVGRAEEDPLLPVRLRAGGRSVGGSMTWGAPKTIAPFPEGSPFHGLPVPADVAVSAQVMAEPGPDLARRTIATLADGTPLVTAKEVGKGRVVLFHVTANAEWSGLPLSGLFVGMLERLAVATRPGAMDSAALAGTTWVPDRVLDAYGQLGDAGTLAGVSGEQLAGMTPSRQTPPGLYAGEDRRLALNALGPERTLDEAVWPAGVRVIGLERPAEIVLKGWFLAAALVALLADLIAALALAGRLRGAAAAAVVLAALALAGPHEAQAQDSAEDRLIEAAGNVVLAYVRTGDNRTDMISAAGLLGLSDVLFARTSVEPILPVGVDLESDDLSVLTFLYWPVTADQKAPSPQAYAKLNRYLRSGGMILFDTRDADVAGFGTATPAGRRLQTLAAPLDIPPLEPIPKDHVLTRSFYLLQDFPGRFAGQTIWVEAAPPDAELAEGMPFRNLNDGVTPVVIGGNDWASAWAIDEQGAWMFPVGRGVAGERQREVAYRFGVNLIMHVLTGNYKSDQVHVPALLERLGQ
ncbi:MAG: DUF4159 domain-containing protein [Rhodobacteraceae bacterium]|nr:DUF4159 domain-containing protein [Paracoccaceae bacterium]